MTMTALQCAMAVLITMSNGLHPGPFRAGFSEMCWRYTYSPIIEVQARWQLTQDQIK